MSSTASPSRAQSRRRGGLSRLRPAMMNQNMMRRTSAVADPGNEGLRRSLRTRAKRSMVQQRAAGKPPQGSETLVMNRVYGKDAIALGWHFAKLHCHCAGQLTEKLTIILRGILFDTLFNNYNKLIQDDVTYSSSSSSEEEFDDSDMSTSSNTEYSSSSSSCESSSGSSSESSHSSSSANPDTTTTDTKEPTEQTVTTTLDSVAPADEVDKDKPLKTPTAASSQDKPLKMSTTASSSKKSAAVPLGTITKKKKQALGRELMTQSDISTAGSSKQEHQSLTTIRLPAPIVIDSSSDVSSSDDVSDDDVRTGAVASTSTNDNVDDSVPMSDDKKMMQIQFESIDITEPALYAIIERHSGAGVHVGYLKHVIRKAVKPLRGLCDKHTHNPIVFHALCMRGKRNYMEDRFVLIENVREFLGLVSLDEPLMSYIGVYDGHAGESTAVYTQMFLHWNIFNHPKFLEGPASRVQHGVDILRESILETDKRWCKLATENEMKAGTTAVCALIVGENVFVANVGDSRCILAGSDTFQELSSIHSPSQQSEKDRISEAGGIVVHFNGWRVNGQYGVSRSIGDLPAAKYLIPDPHVVAHKLSSNDSDEFLILATDGLWDVFTPEDAVKSVRSWWTEYKEGKTRIDISKILFTEATKRGTRDNITIVVAFLKERRLFRTSSKSKIDPSQPPSLTATVSNP